jgi:hypothetical protein
MRVAGQVTGKALVAGVLVTLIASGCSSQGARSALGADAEQADTSASQDASPSPIPTPDDSDVAVAEPSSASASTPALGASPEVQSSEDAEQPLGAGLFTHSIQVCVVNGTPSTITALTSYSRDGRLSEIPANQNTARIPANRHLRNCVNNSDQPTWPSRTVDDGGYDLTLWFNKRPDSVRLSFENPPFLNPYAISNANRDPGCFITGSNGENDWSKCWYSGRLGQREHRWVKDSRTGWCFRVSREPDNSESMGDVNRWKNFRVVVFPSTHPCEGP